MKRNLSKYAAKQTISLLLLFAVSALFSASISAGQLYRYKDEQGIYVLNQTIPPEFVSNGYDILNDKGRVIQIVAPALTSEEILARDVAVEQEKQRKIAKQKQDIIDNELQQLYSHPNDAVRAVKRRIQDIHSVIEVKTNKIESAKLQILAEQSKAAERQRKGLKVGETTLAKITNYRRDIINSGVEITELHSELEKQPDHRQSPYNLAKQMMMQK